VVGSSCGLIELFFQHFTEATEENLRIADIWAEIQTEHLLNAEIHHYM
jgi:ribosomal protein S17E